MMEKFCQGGHPRSFAFFLLALALFSVGVAHGQEFVQGPESDFTPGRMLVRDPFRVVYRDGADSLGRAVLHYALQYEPASRTGGRSCSLYPIFLRTGTSVSDGTIHWVPRRLQLYPLAAHESSVPVLWLDHQVANKLRHRAHMVSLSRNWTTGVWVVLGELSIELPKMLTPPWFLEGDAMHSESRLGGYGRANMATTYQAFRAHLLSGNPLNFDQYLNLSLRYKAPSNKEFGSAMVEWGHWKYGASYWENVLRYVTLRPFYIDPFSIAMGKYGDKGPKGHWDEAFAVMDTIFRTTAHGEADMPAQTRGEYRNHRYPYEWGDNGKRYYFRNSFHHRSQLVEQSVSTGREKVLYEPHYRMGGARYDGSLVAWVQLYQHPLWEQVNWGDVWVYDLGAHRGDRVTHQGQYISPQPRASLRAVDAIRVSEAGEYELVRLSLDSNRPDAERTYRFPRGWELREVVKGLKDDQVVVRAVSALGTMLLGFDWSTGRHELLLGPVRMDISGLAVTPEGVLFSMSNDYMRRAFLAEWADPGRTLGSYYEVRVPSYGVEDLTRLDDGRIAYSSYGVNGYEPGVVTLSSAQLVEVDELEQSGRLFPLRGVGEGASLIAGPVGSEDSVAQVVAGMHEEVYDPTAHAFHFHSWMPFYSGGDGITDFGGWRPGLTLISGNTNGTVRFEVAYMYNRGYHGGEAKLDVNGMWPRLELGGRVGGQPRLWQWVTGPGHPQVYDESGVFLSGHATLRFPITGGAERLGYWVEPMVEVRADNQPIWNPVHEERYGCDVMTQVGLSAGLMRYKAPRDIYPRLGLSVEGSIRHYPVLHRMSSPVFEARGRLNVPGFYHSHVIRIGGHWVRQMDAPLMRSFYFPLRAEAFNAGAEFRRGVRFVSADIDYTLPLAHPDIVLGWFLYIKRFYMTVFGQWGQITRADMSVTNHRLVGGEVMMSFHLLQMLDGMEGGVRLAGSPWRDHLGGKDNWPVSIEGIFRLLPVPLGAEENGPQRLENLLR